MKLERMKALVRSRLDVIEEKQSACVTKLNALSGIYPATDEILPTKVAPRHETGGLLKFPAAKTAAKPVAKARTSLFTGLAVRT
jgi:hypothetical protein